MDTETIQEISMLMESRAHIYNALSKCYETEITGEFAEDLSKSFIFSSDDEELNETFTQLISSVASLDERQIEELAVIFDRVFFGMGPRSSVKAFPYESVYTSVSGYMMQEAYDQVKFLYHKAGFVKNPDFSEPEDHIAVELAFMSMLCTKVQEALAQGDEETAESLVKLQKQFVADHLVNWVDRFTTELEEAAESGFYALLAVGTRLFVKYDQEILNELIS